jgi:site-specific DNA-methyltransferase (adenine-specific)
MNNPTIIGKATLHNMDCMELLKATPDKFYDLAIVDPPYGIGAGSTNFINSGNKYNKEIYRDVDWDSVTPKKEYFEELKRTSKNQIIWGGNYFFSYLDSTRCFLVWDKQVPHDFSYAMCEFAWTSMDKNAKIFVDSNKKDIANRIHPTQKPIKLYEWLLTNYAKQGDKILDTHLGSGSHAIACNNLGFELTACELDKDYFDASVKRIQAANAQIRMFA